MSVNLYSVENAVESKTSKRKMKKLYGKIRNQMEFYFSDSNLAKDKYLYNLVSNDPEGYVDFQVFMTFNKIKELTKDCDVIVSAVSRSSLFEISKDQKRVRRITPIEFKDFDACTLYVEKLPAHADQKWIRDVFGQFGTINYINVPRYKSSNKIKRFAFVEFEKEESVKKACEFYKIVPEKDCTTSEDESKIMKSANKHKSEESPEKVKKNRRRTTSESSDKYNSPFKGNKHHFHSQGTPEKYAEQNKDHLKKKRKRENSMSEHPPKKIKETTESANSNAGLIIKPEDLSPVKEESKSVLVTDRAHEEEVEHLGTSNLQTDKSIEFSDGSDSKLAVKDDFLVSENFDEAKFIVDRKELKTELEDKTMELDESKSKRKRRNSKKHRSHSIKPILRVMPKSEWKAYRNKYLELQRSTMSHLKKHILLELKQLKEQETSAKGVETSNAKKAIQFQPGLILKVTLPEPVKCAQVLKDQVKVHATVAYVDAPVNNSEVYIRCHSSDDASAIVKDEKLKTVGKVELLKDEDEKNYWDKIENDRKVKYSNPVPNKKRGRDKLIAKAAKLEEMRNKHIFFDE